MHGEKTWLQNKLIRIITCSPFRANTGPLYVANKILNVYDINDYIIGSFLYECLYGNISEIFRNYFQRNGYVPDHNLRNANDLYVPYWRLDIIEIQYQNCKREFVELSSIICQKFTINSYI